jgi:uncharacterized membrane protein YbaN (DUF454 family)
MSSAVKLAYILLGFVLLLLGLIGLLVPVIPGVIFLAAAIYVFGRVSRRFHAWTRRSPHWRKLHYRFERLRLVGFGPRLRAISLMCLGACVAGAGALIAGVGRVLRTDTA